MCSLYLMSRLLRIETEWPQRAEMCTCIIFPSVCGCATCGDSASQTKERRQIVVSSVQNEIFWWNFSVGPRWKVAFADKEIEGQNDGKWKFNWRQPEGLVMSPSILWEATNQLREDESGFFLNYKQDRMSGPVHGRPCSPFSHINREFVCN